MTTPDTVLAPTDATDMRTWLEENHHQADGVWVIHRRKGAPESTALIAYDALVLELLCFGWIDGRRRPIDQFQSSVWCTPRRNGSNWSPLNLERYAALEAAGLVAPAGAAARAAWDVR